MLYTWLAALSHQDRTGHAKYLMSSKSGESNCSSNIYMHVDSLVVRCRGVC